MYLSGTSAREPTFHVARCAAHASIDVDLARAQLEQKQAGLIRRENCQIPKHRFMFDSVTTTLVQICCIFHKTCRTPLSEKSFCTGIVFSDVRWGLISGIFIHFV